MTGCPSGAAGSSAGAPALPVEVAEQVEISVKYEGYIQRQAQEVEELQALFPAAAFQPADPTPDGKRWYWVQL